MGFYHFFGVDEFDRECRLVTSHVLTPLLLACLRLAIAVLQIAFLLALLAINLLPEHDGARWFAYFTNITNVTWPAVPLIIDLSGSLHGCCRSTRICIRCLQSHAPPEMA